MSLVLILGSLDLVLDVVRGSSVCLGVSSFDSNSVHRVVRV